MPITPQQAKEQYDHYNSINIKKQLTVAYEHIDNELGLGRRKIKLDRLSSEAWIILQAEYNKQGWLVEMEYGERDSFGQQIATLTFGVPTQ